MSERSYRAPVAFVALGTALRGVLLCTHPCVLHEKGGTKVETESGGVDRSSAQHAVRDTTASPQTPTHHTCNAVVRRTLQPCQRRLRESAQTTAYTNNRTTSISSVHTCTQKVSKKTQLPKFTLTQVHSQIKTHLLIPSLYADSRLSK